MPSLIMVENMPLSITKQLLSISKPKRSRFLARKNTAAMKLKPWLITVARAAPKAPVLRPMTKTQSSAILRAAATAMKMNGCLESPMPLRMPLTAL